MKSYNDIPDLDYRNLDEEVKVSMGSLVAMAEMFESQGRLEGVVIGIGFVGILATARAVLGV